MWLFHHLDSFGECKGRRGPGAGEALISGQRHSPHHGRHLPATPHIRRRFSSPQDPRLLHLPAIWILQRQTPAGPQSLALPSMTPRPRMTLRYQRMCLPQSIPMTTLGPPSKEMVVRLSALKSANERSGYEQVQRDWQHVTVPNPAQSHLSETQLTYSPPS